MNAKVAAVVVTFNRKDLLLECINSLLKQTRPLDAIYIIDNASTDGTREKLIKEGILTKPQVRYYRMEKNQGSSGGFWFGIRLAFIDGYEYVWTMDDDSEPKFDALERLFEYSAEAKQKIAALANLKVDPKEGIQFKHRGYFSFGNLFKYPAVKPVSSEQLKKEYLEIDHCSFVGLLIKREAIKSVGLPKKEFFYQFDDLEYSLRLRQFGKIILCTKSVIFHKEAYKKPTPKGIWERRKTRIPYSNYWLFYYQLRNMIFLFSRHSSNKLNLYIWLINKFLRCIVGVLLFDEEKSRRLLAITNAFWDGLTGHFNNEKPKRILYNH